MESNTVLNDAVSTGFGPRSPAKLTHAMFDPLRKSCWLLKTMRDWARPEGPAMAESRMAHARSAIDSEVNVFIGFPAGMLCVGDNLS